jgi:hypothetical protein
VVAWSNDSIKSDWVIEEADEDRARNILARVLIADVRPPMEFRQIHAPNLVNWRGESEHPEFKRLLLAIESILGPSNKKKSNRLFAQKHCLRRHLFISHDLVVSTT